MDAYRLPSTIVALVTSFTLLTALADAEARDSPSYKVYSSYKAAVNAPGFVSSDPANRRLLTDAQFEGRGLAGTALLGVYYGTEGWDMQRVRDLEGWQGKKDAVVTVHADWCDSSSAMESLFDVQLINVWDNNNVPMVFWEPKLCTWERTSVDVEVQAAQGIFDAHLGAWAGRLKTYLSGGDGAYGTDDDRRVFLRFAHEMNGPWYPWGAVKGDNSPSDYVHMWRRVRGTFDAKGIDATHVQWIWAVNHTDLDTVAERYYPGDAYVDWVGIDGYNWGVNTEFPWSTWKSPAEAYDDMIGRLRRLTTKPLAITEFATTTSAAQGQSLAAKSRWITDVHRYFLARDVRLVSWFNQDKETDWAVFGGANGDANYSPQGDPARPQRFQAWQVVGASLLTAFILAEGALAARLLRTRNSRSRARHQ